MCVCVCFSLLVFPAEDVEPLLYYEEVKSVKEENRSLRDLLEEKEVANEVIRKKLMESMNRTDELQLTIEQGLKDSEPVPFPPFLSNPLFSLFSLCLTFLNGPPSPRRCESCERKCSAWRGS